MNPIDQRTADRNRLFIMEQHADAVAKHASATIETMADKHANLAMVLDALTTKVAKQKNADYCDVYEALIFAWNLLHDVYADKEKQA